MDAEKYVRKHRTYRLESWLGQSRIFSFLIVGFLFVALAQQSAGLGFWTILFLFVFSIVYYSFCVAMYAKEWNRIAKIRTTTSEYSVSELESFRHQLRSGNNRAIEAVRKANKDKQSRK